MSEKKKRERYAFDDAELDLENMQPSRGRNDGKRIRKVSPLGMRVLVRLQSDSNISEGGLYLPEGAKQAMQESLLAEVEEVASAVDSNTHEETNVSGIPQGAIVLIGKNVGVKVPWDDQLRLVDTKDILALVTEISVV